MTKCYKSLTEKRPLPLLVAMAAVGGPNQDENRMERKRRGMEEVGGREGGVRERGGEGKEM